MAPAALAQQEPAFEPGVVVVQFDPGTATLEGAAKTGLAAFDRAASPFGVTSIERPFAFLDHVEPKPETERNLMALRRTYYVRYSADEEPLTVARTLARAEGVTYAEPLLVNRFLGPMALPDDSLFGEQTYLGHLRLPEAWDVVRAGSTRGEEGMSAPPVVIAIVDGGGDWRHEDLVSNVWTNPGEIPGNGRDDDVNGFRDDVHGVNLANEDDSDNDPTGLPQTPISAWHGTAVAGAASAATDNGIGIAGAAWNAKVMHVNVGCPDRETVCHGYRGILYAASNGADVINVSWSGSPREQELKMITEALDFATAHGALVVAAAGNGAEDMGTRFFPPYPAAHPRVLSVGATERDTRLLAAFSNYGKEVNVYAPGEGIVTTAPDDGYSRSLEGTSFAAPLVSGVAALVKTRFPHLSVDALREKVRLASDNMDADNPGHAGRLGSGFVNAETAVQRHARPGVRVTDWSWQEADGDSVIAPGEEITITATVTNHLADAKQLSIGLSAARPYPYLDLSRSEHAVGYLASGASRTVRLRFSVGADPPANERIRLFAHVTDGAFTDEVDYFTLAINRRLDIVHEALSALYLATDGDSWKYNEYWDITRVPTLSELERWRGVTARDGWLITLHLNDNNLAGTLPLELGLLTEIQQLWLRNNALTGPIPAELGQLTLLRTLLLYSNALTGKIPEELGNLSQLETLFLSENALSGAIPPELGKLSRLEWLILCCNNLSGEIPTEFGNLLRLEMLALGQNYLSGPIPPELGKLSRLESLTLFENNLSGPIPPELGKLAQLKLLYLHENDLSGPIPAELGKLSRLKRLTLFENNLSGPIPPELGQLAQLERLKLESNNLSGPIPPELGKLAQLKSLTLRRNNLSGPIPAELGNLSELGWLRLQYNELSGPIPAELGRLARLRALTADDNNLSGPIPAELGNLPELQELVLRSNNLSGPIPPELGKLAQLERLRLESNNLSGPIPPELGKLAQLKSLTLQSNNLSGPIPAELGNLAHLSWVEMYENGLSGPIPPELGKLSELRRLKLGHNELSGAIPAELGQLVNLQNLFLADNALSGAIPPELGNLAKLEHLRLESNNLSGAIPPELGNLAKLQVLSLENNALSGPVPPELGNLSELVWLALNGNELTGKLPRSLMQLTNLNGLHFHGQALCAPQDEAFQAWLRGKTDVDSPTCTGVYFAEDIPDQSFTRDEAVAPLVFPEAAGGSEPYAYSLRPTLPAGLIFDDSTRTISGTPTELLARTAYTYAATDADGRADSLTFAIEVLSPLHILGAGDIPDQSFTRDEAVAPLVFPEAAGGSEPYAYSLRPTLPAGLIFDDSTRTISGTPTELLARTAYTYAATDADGRADSLTFAIEVLSPLHILGAGDIPSEFAVHGNHPNPFRHVTRLAFDLPWPARVTVEVLDLTGRRVLMLPEEALAAGRSRTIEVSGSALSSGLYFYRLVAASPEGTSVHAGRFVRVR